MNRGVPLAPPWSFIVEVGLMALSPKSHTFTLYVVPVLLYCAHV
jgi:hypothetical protein